MISTWTLSVLGSITASVLASYIIYRRREKLFLVYTVTESHLFPILAKQGKYYAVKISNTCGKLVKNLVGFISVSDGLVAQVTPHELVKFDDKFEDGVFK